jgi:hypothetical protein
MPSIFHPCVSHIGGIMYEINASTIITTTTNMLQKQIIHFAQTLTIGVATYYCMHIEADYYTTRWSETNYYIYIWYVDHFC